MLAQQTIEVQPTPLQLLRLHYNIKAVLIQSLRTYNQFKIFINEFKAPEPPYQVRERRERAEELKDELRSCRGKQRQKMRTHS